MHRDKHKRQTVASEADEDKIDKKDEDEDQKSDFGMEF